MVGSQAMNSLVPMTGSTETGSTGAPIERSTIPSG